MVLGCQSLLASWVIHCAAPTNLVYVNCPLASPPPRPRSRDYLSLHYNLENKSYPSTYRAANGAFAGGWGVAGCKLELG